MIGGIKKIGSLNGNCGFVGKDLFGHDAYQSRTCRGDLLDVGLVSVISIGPTHPSSEKKPGCLGYIGAYTSQLCGASNKPL